MAKPILPDEKILLTLDGRGVEAKKQALERIRKEERGDFTPEEKTIILEAAKMTLSDADMFDDLANFLDLSDEEMVRLREKVTLTLAGN